MEINNNDKYIACDLEDHVFEKFQTIEDAKDWCDKRSANIVIENRSDYPDLNIPLMQGICILKVEMVNQFDGTKYFVGTENIIK